MRRALYANIFAVRLKIAYRVYMLHSALDYCRFVAGPRARKLRTRLVSFKSAAVLSLCADVMLCFALVVECRACCVDVCSVEFMFCVVFFATLRNKYVL